jgi:hypothetical protein
MNDARVRRPGEAAFAIAITLVSAFLAWTAYEIAGFEALSSPGALPMAAAGTMLVCAIIILAQTLRSRPASDQSLKKDVVPLPILLTVGLVLAYALLLKPLGFLPTSFLFVLILIRVLSGFSLAFCAAVSAGSVLLIYLVFRIIFNVIMPEGIVPEREILAAIGALLPGGK